MTSVTEVWGVEVSRVETKVVAISRAEVECVVVSVITENR